MQRQDPFVTPLLVVHTIFVPAFMLEPSCCFPALQSKSDGEPSVGRNDSSSPDRGQSILDAEKSNMPSS